MKTFKQFYESDAPHTFSNRIDHALDWIATWYYDDKLLGIDEWVKNNTPEFDTVSKLANLMLKGELEFARDLSAGASDPDQAFSNAAFLAATKLGLDEKGQVLASVYYNVRDILGWEPSDYKINTTAEGQKARSQLYETIRRSEMFTALWNTLPVWAEQQFDPEQSPFDRDLFTPPPPPDARLPDGEEDWVPEPPDKKTPWIYPPGHGAGL